MKIKFMAHIFKEISFFDLPTYKLYTITKFLKIRVEFTVESRSKLTNFITDIKILTYRVYTEILKINK